MARLALVVLLVLAQWPTAAAALGGVPDGGPTAAEEFGEPLVHAPHQPELLGVLASSSASLAPDHAAPERHPLRARGLEPARRCLALRLPPFAAVHAAAPPLCERLTYFATAPPPAG